MKYLTVPLYTFLRSVRQKGRQRAAKEIFKIAKEKDCRAINLEIPFASYVDLGKAIAALVENNQEKLTIMVNKEKIISYRDYEVFYLEERI